MRSLFWRIFAATWLAYVAVIVAQAWITTVSFETEQIPGLEMTRLQAVMDEQLRRLDRSARRGGAERLEQSMRIAGSMGPVEFYALDAGDKDLLGQVPSRDILDAAALVRSGAPVNAERLRALASTLKDDERPLVLVAATEGSMLSRAVLRRPFGGWTHIIVALLASALVSALLAWYVAAPLARIRASTRRFAEGDLDARVGRLRFGRSREMDALAVEFDRMAGRIKALIENNRRLVRDVSHELRSPLARLRVALELARGQQGDAVERSMDRIERHRERFRLDELVEDVIANADYEGSPRGRRVVSLASTPIDIDGSRDALYSAIENIVRNALAYSPDGGQVEVRLEASAQQVRLRIRDHGPGVAEADLARIFEPFYRTDAARARSSGGTGLGLAIANRAIGNHHGTVVARNADGGGLEVVIELPALTRMA